MTRSGKSPLIQIMKPKAVSWRLEVGRQLYDGGEKDASDERGGITSEFEKWSLACAEKSMMMRLTKMWKTTNGKSL